MVTAKTNGNANIVLLTGFLGSGKTTLLKQILSWEANLSGTVVVVNEFGDVGIDGALLKNSGSEVVELNSGCICCTLAADLKQSLDLIWKEFRPVRILIESSGVADPTAVSSVLSRSSIKKYMTLEKIIAVLDADIWAAREAFGPLFFNQLEMAQLILLNKVDLLDKGLIPEFLKEIHAEIPNSQVVPTIHCRIDPEVLWADPKPKMFGLKPMDFFNNQTQRASVDASHYVTFAFQSDLPLDEARFEVLLDQLPYEMFRVKGPVRFSDRTMMLNYVGGRAEWSPWQLDVETQLAFIGWHVNSEDILEKVNACIVSFNEQGGF